MLHRGLVRDTEVCITTDLGVAVLIPTRSEFKDPTQVVFWQASLDCLYTESPVTSRSVSPSFDVSRSDRFVPPLRETKRGTNRIERPNRLRTLLYDRNVPWRIVLEV